MSKIRQRRGFVKVCDKNGHFFDVPKRYAISIGERINDWEVLSIPFCESGVWKMECRCGCGVERIISANNLCYGMSKNCGHGRNEHCRKLKFSHGDYGSALNRVWKNMKQRCSDENYRRYAGRGISVCSEWLNSYVEFRDWAIANGWRDDLQIDRKDNDGNYCPENCRFVTQLENCNNTSQNTIIEAFGESKTLSEWSRSGFCKVSYTCLRARLRRGVSPELAITTPVRK